MKHIVAALLCCCCCSLLQAQHFNTKDIDTMLSKVYTDNKPGIAIGIVANGKTIFKKSYGLANMNTMQRITAASAFNICSLTKQFTAIAILQLQQKHLLALNDKLSKFFSDMNTKVADVVTVKELLSHNSGIIDHYDFTNTAGMQHAHNIDVYNAIKNSDSTYFKPGTQFRYSNTAYCLLALIIEKLSGLQYNDYMERYVFKPAGMSNTVIWNENTIIKNEVTGYDYDSAKQSFKRSGAAEHIFFSTEGDGGVYTSTDDYIKWFEALQNSKVFSKTITDEAREIQFVIDANKKVGYGFGWFVDDSGAAKKVYHSGDNGGFRTYSFSIPSKNYLVVIFSNRSDVNLENFIQKIIEMQWPGLLPFIKIEALTS